jgi:hypothetical protein
VLLIVLVLYRRLVALAFDEQAPTVVELSARVLAGEPGRVAVEVRDLGLADRHQFGASFGIGQAKHADFQIDIFPFEGLNFPKSAYGQQQKADAVGGFGLIVGLTQHLAEASEFIRCEIALALDLLVALDAIEGIVRRAQQLQVVAGVLDEGAPDQAADRI